MKKALPLILMICLLLVGCSKEAQVPATAETVPATTTAPEATVAAEPMEAPNVISPLPDSTMENMADAVLSVSLSEGDAYVDDTGKMQMDVTVYSYDKYDMVDISMLKAGDVLVTSAGEVEIVSIERKENGTVLINGGLDENGFDLVTDESGIFYESGYNDAKNWYEVGKATIRVSADFTFCDTSDLDAGEILYYPGSFLVGEVTNYNFTPFNTTIRIEDGQIIEMHRVYTP